MGNAANALRKTAEKLKTVSDTPRLDAELLMAHALRTSREQLLLDLPKLKSPPEFDALVERRMQNEPIAYITGEKEFWGLSFSVTPDVLIPRPDSEIMIEEALRLFAGKQPAHILDLGTGSGALLLAALSEFPNAKGKGIDVSEGALAIAQENAEQLGLADRIRFSCEDWNTSGWPRSDYGRFDLILTNPPYVSTQAALPKDVAGFEPQAALFAGKDGMDAYHVLIPALDKLLAPKGIALVEIGFDQGKIMADCARKYGYHVECKQDLGGNDRLLTLRH